jgi:FkbM family methyltransferase
MNYFKNIILKLLPKSISILLVRLYSYLKQYAEFYYSLLSGKNKISFSSLLFPFTGRLKTMDFSLHFPSELWNTWKWVVDIKELGGNITWIDDDRYICAEKEGLKIYSNPRDESMGVVFREMFEEDEYGLDRFDFKDLTVMDVGANIGDTAVNFLKRGASHVHSFEPLEFLRQPILLNFSMNGFEDKTTLHMVALGDTEKSTELYVRKNATAGTSVILHDADTYEKKANYETVRVGIVDSLKYFRENNILSTDVLKLDCEHCEYTLFKNTEVIDFLKPSYVFIEYHAGYESLRSILQECGYKVSIEEKNQDLGILTAVKLP